MNKLHRLITKDKRYEYAVFHPSKFEDGVYVARRHIIGENWTDKNIEQIELNATSERDALKKAKTEWNKW